MSLLTIIPVIIMGVVSTIQSKRIIVEKMNSINRSNMAVLNQQITNKFALLGTILQGLPNNMVVRSFIGEAMEDGNEYDIRYNRLYDEMYSSRNLAGLGMPSSYVFIMKNGKI